MDRSKPIHFVGIGGIGMSAIAQVLLAEGYSVTGSDLRPSSLTEKLAEKGARVFSGHAGPQVGDAGLVVISSAVPADNPEILEAGRRQVPVIKRAEMLGHLMAGRYGIAIGGTHGKTTTSCLIALLLERAGLDPTMLLGGESIDLGSNAKLGKGPHMVAEADEFDGSFLHLRPTIAVVTNVEPEHLDYYGSFPQVVDAFRRFLASVPPQGRVVVCADDPRLAGLVEGPGCATEPEEPQILPHELRTRNIVTYGLSPLAQWRALDLSPNSAGGTDFTLLKDGAVLGRLGNRIPGEHNVVNTLAALAVGSALELPLPLMQQVLAEFRGAHRRFEVVGEARGVTIVDDYAHHPTEIRATLRAARDRFGTRRITCVFQPHTYSRTKLLFKEFTTAFPHADEVIITDIYAAREQDRWGVHARDLVGATDHPHIHYLGGLEEVIAELSPRLQEGDVLLTLGAGDVYRVAEGMLETLRRSSP